MKQRLVLGAIIFIDLFLFYFILDALYPHSIIIYTALGRTNLEVLMFSPLSIVLNSQDIWAQNINILQIACRGLFYGLITPPIFLLNVWYPALLGKIGILHDHACKLLLEDFNEHLTFCLHEIIPTAVFGALAWAAIYTFNSMLIKLYQDKFVPTATRLAKRFKKGGHA